MQGRLEMMHCRGKKVRSGPLGSPRLLTGGRLAVAAPVVLSLLWLEHLGIKGSGCELVWVRVD